MTSYEPASVQIPLNAALKLREDLRIKPQELAHGPCYVIEDPFRQKFYRVGVREFTFLSLLDGKTTLGEALGLAATALGRDALTEAESLSLADWIVACQLVEGDRPRLRSSRSLPSKTKGRCLWNIFRQPLFIKLPLLNPNRLLDSVWPWCGWLVGRQFLAVWLAVVAWGVVCSLSESRRLFDPSIALLDPGNWGRMLLAWCFLSLCHEWFHALMCKKYGGTVSRAGIALIMFAPAAYVDVTSSWRFTSKWQRIATAAAGIYAEFFVASIAILIWSRTDDGLGHRLCYDMALLASVGTLLFNANPLLRFDGYYVLSDLLDIPNLAPLGRQYLVYLAQRYLAGVEVVAPALPPRHSKLIKLYAFAAAGWRLLLVTLISIWLVGVLSYLGAVLVLLALIHQGVLPMLRAWKRLINSGATIVRTARQWIFLGGVGTCAAAFAWTWFAGQSIIRAPATVEYAPLSIIRANSPGFVEEILVHNGERICAGQILVRLENHELRIQLADVQLEAEKHRIQGRIYFQSGEVAKYQIEDSKRRAVEKKIGELKRQVDALEIRSATTGRLVARQLESLIGRYLESGAQIAMIGNEDSKELVVAIAQDDIDVFVPQLGRDVDVHVWGMLGGQFQAVLEKMNPGAQLEAPHEFLSANVGGPLAVKARELDGAVADQRPWELLRPAFVGKIPLSQQESRNCWAGQLVTVSFHSTAQSRYERVIKLLKHWVGEQIECASQATY